MEAVTGRRVSRLRQSLTAAQVPAVVAAALAGKRIAVRRSVRLAPVAVGDRVLLAEPWRIVRVLLAPVFRVVVRYADGRRRRREVWADAPRYRRTHGYAQHAKDTRWRLPSDMPRWVGRFVLEVTAVATTSAGDVRVVGYVHLMEGGLCE